MAESDNVEGQIGSLRDHVDARFAGLERWTERLSAAVEKLNENSGRYSSIEQLIDLRIKGMEEKVRVVETRLNETQNSNQKKFESIEKSIDAFYEKLGERMGRIELKIAYWSGSIFIVGLVAQLLIKKMGM